MRVARESPEPNGSGRGFEVRLWRNTLVVRSD